MLRGIQGDIVETRIIRHHYGIEARVNWNPEIHEKGDKRRVAESKKSWLALEQKYVCLNVMWWYVKRVRREMIATHIGMQNADMQGR